MAPPLSSKNVKRINNKDDIGHTVMFVDAVSVIPMLLKFVQLLEPSVQSVATNSIRRRK